MFGNLVKIFAVHVNKPAAFGAFQVIMQGTFAAFVNKFKASALSLLGNIFAYRPLPHQLIKMTVNGCLSDRAARLCKLGNDIIGREMSARLLLQK